MAKTAAENPAPGAPLVTAARMRAIEGAAIAGGTVTGRALMERAGAAVTGAMFDEWPDLRHGARRAAILCGPGNNGGDGYVIARMLHGLGWSVAVHALGDPARLPPDARANHDAWCALGPVTPIAPGSDAPLVPAACDVVVDALFGTGLSRLVDLPLGRIGARVVAVDLPSGLCSDSGRALGGRAVAADLTVAFHARKPGHVLAEGPDLCGRVVVADIELAHDTDPGDARLIGAPGAFVLKRNGHKYDHGHALVLTGGVARTGAARLAARAALRAGAGLVTLGPPGAALSEVAAHVTAEMIRRVDDEGALGAALQDKRLSALCLGPGMGASRAAALLPVVLASGRPTVLDADALGALAAEPALLAQVHDGCVLTPHDGEFARLFPDLAEPLRGVPSSGPAVSRIDAARAAAARSGAIVLLKGPDTVIAAPDGTGRVLASHGSDAVPWLATAGAGDVLAGIVAGLCARGIAPFEAAVAGAWLHAQAARRFGPGLIATDLPEALPAVFAALDADLATPG